MRKKLLAVGVAATLSALGSISAAAIYGRPSGREKPAGQLWADGGKHRSHGRYRSGLSPAERLQAKARQARRKEG